MFFFLHNRIPSFKCAFSGLVYVIKTQKNAWIHAVATILVIALGLICKLSLTNWALIFFAIGFVWASESINTSIEVAIDLVSPQYHSLAKVAKDTAAATVLIAAITAVAIGLVVFIPAISTLLSFK